MSRSASELGPDLAGWWRAVLTLHPEPGELLRADPAPSAFPRLYGGQLAAQGLLAGAATVDPARTPHSLHTAFLRGGDPARPVHHRVERVRESRTLSTRVVRTEQDDRLLATSTVSFHLVPDPVGHPLSHEPPPDRPAAAPDGLATRPERLASVFGDDVPAHAAARWPLDVRYVDRAPWDDRPPGEPVNRLWLRAQAELGDSPAVHAAALAYATDWHMFEPLLFPHDIGWLEMISGRTVYGTTLDHTLWFHRPARVDRWLLLDQVAPVAADSRGFTRAEVRTPDGRLVASVAQEACFVTPR